MSNKYKILIITTKGCEACSILRDNVKQAISAHSLDIELETKDRSECDKKWLTTNRVHDFPAIFLIQNDIIRYKYIGSMPPIVILRWCDIYFNK